MELPLHAPGFEPIVDLKGTKDLFGNILKFTSQNLADGLASLGVMVMGESDKSTPVILVRDVDFKLTDKKISSDELGMESKFDIYIRGLSLPNQKQPKKLVKSLNFK